MIDSLKGHEVVTSTEELLRQFLNEELAGCRIIDTVHADRDPSNNELTIDHVLDIATIGVEIPLTAWLEESGRPLSGFKVCGDVELDNFVADALLGLNGPVAHNDVTALFPFDEILGEDTIKMIVEAVQLAAEEAKSPTLQAYNSQFQLEIDFDSESGVDEISAIDQKVDFFKLAYADSLHHLGLGVEGDPAYDEFIKIITDTYKDPSKLLFDETTSWNDMVLYARSLLEKHRTVVTNEECEVAALMLEMTLLSSKGMDDLMDTRLDSHEQRMSMRQ